MSEEVKQAAVQELRRVADELEANELTLTEAPRITHIGFDGSMPLEIELTYYRDGVGERHIEVY